MAWWFYLNPHANCCPFVCAKRKERPRSCTEAWGQRRASLAAAELVNHGAVIGLLGLKPMGWPAEGKSLSFCSSRWGQLIGFGLTSLALVCFSLVGISKIYIDIFFFFLFKGKQKFNEGETKASATGRGMCSPRNWEILIKKKLGFFFCVHFGIVKLIWKSNN